MRSVEARPVDKALANGVVRGTSLANVEGAIEKARHAHAGDAVPRVNAMAAVVPLT